MGRKGKAQKHTAAEIAAKHAAKHNTSAGGGDAVEKRKNVGNKISAKSEICMSIHPNIISMEAHYDSKHRKIKFQDVRESYEKLFSETKANIVK